MVLLQFEFNKLNDAGFRLLEGKSQARQPRAAATSA
jgi:hypothetical protein